MKKLLLIFLATMGFAIGAQAQVQGSTCVATGNVSAEIKSSSNPTDYANIEVENHNKYPVNVNYEIVYKGKVIATGSVYLEAAGSKNAKKTVSKVYFDESLSSSTEYNKLRVQTRVYQCN